ncbi:phage tail protein [Hymenobacter ruricola]|uniref:Phage tail protein n=1 Tax=Hymenobacter ruricola TaxID=2791023 RepID=A0ABS0I2J5_9BACT|nr:tail fiber protein [Hymenobacter ruricola]MBF9221176.1 phage tail protein [Hymenobacter ruricola]
MEPYLGEIRIFGGTFAPVGWLFCNGSLLSISEYDALYALIGTTYGGDGQTTFAVPNMASRVAVGQGQGPGLSSYVIGQMQGTETVTLTSNQLPVHQHPFSGTVNVISGATTPVTDPTNAFFADKGALAYINTSGADALAPTSLTGQMTPAGGSQPHSNLQPLTAIYYIICTSGIYPTQP